MKKFQLKLKSGAESKTICINNYDIFIDGEPMSLKEATGLIDIKLSLKAGETPKVHLIYSNVEMDIDTKVEQKDTEDTAYYKRGD